VLNYTAVVKAVKKGNKNLGLTTQAVQLLAGEPIFASLGLAKLVTRAEMLTVHAAPGADRKVWRCRSAGKNRDEKLMFQCLKPEHHKILSTLAFNSKLVALQQDGRHMLPDLRRGAEQPRHSSVQGRAEQVKIH